MEQSSGPSAATAMRGARGAWDFLFVLLLLLLVQTGGRALRVLGPRLPPPPGAACAPLGSEYVGVAGERWLPVRSSFGKIRGGPGTLLRPALLTCAGSPPQPVVGALSCESFRKAGGEGLTLRAAGCV